MLGRYSLYIAPIRVARYRVIYGAIVAYIIGGSPGGAILAGVGVGYI